MKASYKAKHEPNDYNQCYTYGQSPKTVGMKMSPLSRPKSSLYQKCHLPVHPEGHTLEKVEFQKWVIPYQSISHASLFSI